MNLATVSSSCPMSTMAHSIFRAALWNEMDGSCMSKSDQKKNETNLNETLKRMLKSPPKPHKEKVAEPDGRQRTSSIGYRPGGRDDWRAAVIITVAGYPSDSLVLVKHDEPGRDARVPAPYAFSRRVLDV